MGAESQRGFGVWRVPGEFEGVLGGRGVSLEMEGIMGILEFLGGRGAPGRIEEVQGDREESQGGRRGQGGLRRS